MTTTEIAEQALARAQSGQSFANYGTIISGFAEKGIPEADITPRVNVLTYKAWQALGRQVKRGEHGVRVLTFQHFSKTEKQPDGTEKQSNWSRPWSAVVFHVSQTEARS